MISTPQTGRGPMSVRLDDVSQSISKQAVYRGQGNVSRQSASRRLVFLLKRSWFRIALGVAVALLVGDASLARQQDQQIGDKPLKKPSEFDAERAFGYLKDVCKIGTRVSASGGMKRQQKYIRDHMKKLGGEVLDQKFTVKSPYHGRNVELTNLVVRFHPDREKRLMICCHYDTRPFADRDPRNPRAAFIGANDGGSGVGLLCELAQHLSDMKGPFGVDLAFFDGEEFVIDKRIHPMFLGSTHFAEEYKAGRVPWKYEYAILVDMVADKDLQIYYEGNSLASADRLTQSIWSVANELGVKEFVAEKRHQIRDDHLPLNQIAKIPTCDIIDFDYPNPQRGNAFWHTREDAVRNCSAESLGKVGSVVLEWLRQMQDIYAKQAKQGPRP